MASNVYDLALSYYLIAGPDSNDSNSLQQPLPTIQSFIQVESLKGVKLGVFWPYFNDANPEIVQACKSSLEKFSNLGAEIIDIEIPELFQIRSSHLVSICSEMSSRVGFLPRHKMSYPSRIAFGLFATLSAKVAFFDQDFIAAARMRTRGMNIFRRIFDRVDAIVTPTTGITAPKIPNTSLAYGFSDYTTSLEAMKYICMNRLTSYR